MKALILLFTSLNGRIGRLGYWFGMGAILLAGASLTLPAMPSIFSQNPFLAIWQNMRQLGLYGLAVSLALFYPAIAVTVKRLHDRNKSGWLTTLIWLPVLVNLAGWLLQADWWLNDVWWIGKWLLLEMFAVGFWFFVELGFYPGTDGPNRYGPE